MRARALTEAGTEARDAHLGHFVIERDDLHCDHAVLAVVQRLEHLAEVPAVARDRVCRVWASVRRRRQGALELRCGSGAPFAQNLEQREEGVGRERCALALVRHGRQSCIRRASNFPVRMQIAELNIRYDENEHQQYR